MLAFKKKESRLIRRDLFKPYSKVNYFFLAL